MNPQTFLTQVLQNPGYSIPIEANFGVYMNDLLQVANNILNVRDIISDNNLAIKTDAIRDIGESSTGEVFFATSVNLPGEVVNSSRVGYTADNTVYGGLLSGPVLKGRRDPNNLEITFIETNESFLDYFLRPWIVAVSQYGLYTRGSASTQNFKTTLQIDFFDKTYNTKTPVRKTLIFKDAAPVDVGGYEAAYGKSTGLRTNKTSWIYSTYTVK
jgi:hypothetical protein